MNKLSSGEASWNGLSTFGIINHSTFRGKIDIQGANGQILHKMRSFFEHLISMWLLFRNLNHAFHVVQIFNTSWYSSDCFPNRERNLNHGKICQCCPGHSLGDSGWLGGPFDHISQGSQVSKLTQQKTMGRGTSWLKGSMFSEDSMSKRFHCRTAHSKMRHYSRGEYDRGQIDISRQI